MKTRALVRLLTCGSTVKRMASAKEFREHPEPKHTRNANNNNNIADQNIIVSLNILHENFMKRIER